MTAVVVNFLATNIITFLVIIIITKTTVLAQDSGDVAPLLIAKPNCSSKCGNVRIPFPFGIGSDCSFDKWFEIVCRSTPYPKPFLKQIPQVEVLNISTENGTLRTRNPISFMDCPEKKRPSIINLSGSPFSFSDTRNRFIVVGCNYRAFIGPRPNNSFLDFGCFNNCPSLSTNTTTRGSNNTIDGCELGRNCCETTIPSYLINNTITFEKPFSNSTRCESYAFVVDIEWFESRSNKEVVGKVTSDMDYVPFIILLNQVSKSRNCYTTEATSSINGFRLRCNCVHGYRGNPYLSQGCQDIDECKEYSANNHCPEDTICVNIPGDYRCDLNTVHKVDTVLIGLGSAIGALVIVFGAWGLYKVIKRRKDIKSKRKFFKQNGGLLLQQQTSSGEVNVDHKIKLFNSKELEKATDHYNTNRILGQGGQGTVYKGMLEDGKIVAVKKSKLDNQGKVKEFINEVIILTQINHRNVVKLLGCCLETEVPLLVYEFIPNGTLYHYIHDQNEEFQLSWEMRLRIATEVAEALSYLHFALSSPIYHRDIKSTNILLDDKYRAKVADFGTSRSISEGQTHLTTRVSGTFGYMDPEYFQSSQFTEKSDVYSFGVVIVELLSGQKPVSLTSSRKGRGLATYFIDCMERNCVFDIIDDRIIEGDCKAEMMAVANLAYRCLNLIGKNRPTMKEVVLELEGIQNSRKLVSSEDRQIFENVAYPIAEELVEPWDFTCTSIRVGSCSTVSMLDPVNAS